MKVLIQLQAVQSQPENLRALPRVVASVLLLALAAAATLSGQQISPTANDDRQTMKQLLDRVTELEAEVKDLKSERSNRGPAPEALAAAPTSMTKEAQPPQVKSEATARAAMKSVNPTSSETEKGEESAKAEAHEHTMTIPGGGPTLKMRGFLDFNFDAGSYANNLIFPLGAPAHTSFRFGEFDLFISSKLSETVDFLSETIIGSDATNFWGLDIERAEIEYKPNDYFHIAAGRYHHAIGYYNTLYHHGTWFQSATGRPYILLFEDSGGILPVHGLGITATGLVPGMAKGGLHWVAEVSNGRRSRSPADQPVQNFLDENNRKAFNVAIYARPEWLSGLQVGASYYRDRLTPEGLPHINQSIESVYADYVSPTWEFFNEGFVIRNTPDGQNRTFNSPMFFTQIGRRVGKYYRPYFRYQYVNVPSGDLINGTTVGRKNGPSAGIRFDFTDYAALKLQYNHLAERGKSLNGFEGQVAFTF